ncbi:tetratricopeptide repeat protein [Bacillus sp. FJAT-27251]|uniref:tetratricopeptide repeat protein n=1 Tax=Bacillus sp. FJAT-27251 TaxID=1684142 RepID=UPI0006A7B777|nr:tetratricopeptide repeat protein [Bacillus sp. FJAT-27251]
MKKRDLKKEGNIILFPGLERRLMDKGLELLHARKFRQAAEFLEQAVAMEHDNAEARIGLVVAYYEAGRVKEAKKLAAGMLRDGVGDYIQVMDLYIMILVQLGEYEEIITTIEGLLEGKHVPTDKFEHFSKMLQFSRKMAEGKAVPVENDVPGHSEAERLQLFECKDPDEQMMVAARLANENIRPHLPEIKKYLASDSGHPFLKSMLLNILKEQEYDGELQVEKFGRKASFIPARLPDVHEMMMSDVFKLLEDKFENDDPVFLENIKGMAERNFFLLYPFDPEPNNPLAWAGAYDYLGKSYYGHEWTLEQYIEENGGDEEEIGKAVEAIRKIEEISYPII